MPLYNDLECSRIGVEQLHFNLTKSSQADIDFPKRSGGLATSAPKVFYVQERGGAINAKMFTTMGVDQWRRA